MSLSPVPPTALPARLGRLRQATLRRSRACSELSRPLYAPRRHLQPWDLAPEGASQYANHCILTRAVIGTLLAAASCGAKKTNSSLGGFAHGPFVCTRFRQLLC